MIAPWLLSIRSLGPSLANHLWQSTAFALVIGVLALWVRKNRAHVRYGLWLAASLKFLVPFSLLIGLGSLLPLRRTVVAPQPVFYAAAAVVAQPFSENVLPVETQVPSLHDRFLAWFPPALAILWLCGALIAALVWYSRWREVAAALRKATLVERGREFGILRRLEHQANRPNRFMRRTIPLLLSRDRREPGIFGIFRPVLLWPEELSEHLDDEHIEAILAHEMLHARRHDNLAAALHMLVEALFWFHPLVWWMEGRLIEERERACDEAVMSMGSKSKAYAEGLLKACRFCVESPLSCVSGITGADLRERIVRIMTASLGESLSGAKKALLASAAVIAVAVPIVFGQQEQQSAMQASKTGAHPSLSFEVVSIKPNHSGAGMGNIGFPGIHGPADRFIATNTTIKVLIGWAYAENSSGPFLENQIAGGPSWISSERYDIDAKLDDAQVAALAKLSVPDRRLQVKRMVQSWLADRFGLVVKNPAETPVYALVVAKGGPKLREAVPGSVSSIAISGPSGPPPPPPPPPPPGGSSSIKAQGDRASWGTSTPGEIRGHAEPMSDLAQSLSQGTELGRPVLDETGLKGTYDFDLKWTFDPNSPGAPPGPSSGAATAPPDGPSIFTAIQEQLGLKLESAQGRPEGVVIVHIERPSEN